MLKMDPGNAKALYRKAKMLLTAGNIDEATEIVRTYLASEGQKTDEAAFKKLSEEI